MSLFVPNYVLMISLQVFNLSSSTLLGLRDISFFRNVVLCAACPCYFQRRKPCARQLEVCTLYYLMYILFSKWRSNLGSMKQYVCFKFNHFLENINMFFIPIQYSRKLIIYYVFLWILIYFQVFHLSNSTLLSLRNIPFS